MVFKWCADVGSVRLGSKMCGVEKILTARMDHKRLDYDYIICMKPVS